MPKKMILLFGKKGQLGSVLREKLKNSHLKAYDYPEIDFNHPEQVKELIRYLKPELIINAAAFTAVDLAEKDRSIAMNINGYSVGAIAEGAKEIGAGLIHYSTDYVFDGKKQNLYKENDQPNPINVYGESKLLGEKKIIETGDVFLIFRLSWVYSITHPSFVTKVLEWSRNYETLKIVDDQISNPTWANMVAEKTVELIERGEENWPDFIQQNHGFYHLPGKGAVSRYDWAKTILELDPFKHQQIAKKLLPAKSDDFDNLALRPNNSGLDCTKFEKTFNIDIPHWKEALEEAMAGAREYKMNPVAVEILLATYNGEKYLSAQLESILQQSFQDFRILVSDDGSKDSTLKIIDKFAELHAPKIQLIPKEDATSGLIKNFSKLIAASTAPYLLLSDQDDFWLPNKVEVLLSRLTQLEEEFSTDTPILVHSDLFVVDEELNLLADSFWKYIGINPNRKSFGNLLIQNNVTGCTSIFNRALADLCGPIPEEAMMHDWWLGLIASSMGELHFIEPPTVLYRQHGSNTLGAQPFSWSFSYFFEKVAKLFKFEEKDILMDFIDQAEIFFNRYNQYLSPKNTNTIIAFKDINTQGFLEKRFNLIRYGLLREKFVQNIGLFIRI